MHLETVEYQTCIERGIKPARLTVLATGTAVNGPWRVDLYRRSAGYQCAGSLARIHSEEYGFAYTFTNRRGARTFYHAQKSLSDAAAEYNARVDQASQVYLHGKHLYSAATGNPCEPQA